MVVVADTGVLRLGFVDAVAIAVCDRLSVGQNDRAVRRGREARERTHDHVVMAARRATLTAVSPFVRGSGARMSSNGASACRRALYAALDLPRRGHDCAARTRFDDERLPRQDAWIHFRHTRDLAAG